MLNSFVRAMTLALFVWSLPAVAFGNGSDSPTGIFTNMTRDAATGDFSGIELFIVKAGGKYHAMFQCGAGDVSEPVLVELFIREGSVKFTIPSDFRYFCDYGDFRGTISGDVISGEFVETQGEVTLKKGLSFWQR